MLKQSAVYVLITLSFLTSSTPILAGGGNSKMAAPQVEDEKQIPLRRKESVHVDKAQDELVEESFKNPSAESLRDLCLTPGLFVRVHKKVLDLVHLPETPGQFKHPLLDTYTDVIVKEPMLHESFVACALETDPLDTRAAFLCWRVVSTSEDILKRLREVVRDTTFQPTSFVELCKDPDQRVRLKKHMMALQMLTVVEEGRYFEQRFDQIGTIQCCYVKQLLEKEDLSDEDKAFVLSQPFWPVYSLKFEFWDSSLSLLRKIMESTPPAQLDLDKYFEFAKCRWYFYTINQRTNALTQENPFPERLMLFYETLVKAYSKAGDPQKRDEVIDTMYNTFGKISLNNILNISNLYYVSGNPQKAISSLLEQAEHPFVSVRALKIILRMKSKGEWQEIPGFEPKSLVENIRPFFSGKFDPLVEYLCSSTGSYSLTIHYGEFRDLEAALALVNGEFATALDWIQARHESMIYLRGIQKPFEGQPVLDHISKGIAHTVETGLQSLQSSAAVEECLFAAYESQRKNEKLPEQLRIILEMRKSNQ
jgi:hypothetical protein